MKKISLILLAMAVCISPVFAKTNSDYTNDVELICALGIMRGYEDGEFRPDGYLTRSEAVVTVSALAGVLPDFSKNTFADVAESHWAKAYIEAAAGAGIVSGVAPGVFEPDKKVTKYQVAVMLLNTMGYSVVVKPDENGIKNYTGLIAEKGLYSGISESADEPLTRGGFARMISNALEEPLLNTGISGGYPSYAVDGTNTLLSEYLGVYIAEGQITANGITGLTGGSTVPDSHVRIGTDIYDVGSTDIADYIGRFVKVYYYEPVKDEKTVAYYILSQRESILVNSEDIVSYNAGVFTYYNSNGGKQYAKSVNVLPVADVIFNGVYKIPSDSDFMPAKGYVELYDSDKDGIFDVVYIKSYTLYVAESVDSEKMIITDRYNNTSLRFEEDDDVSVFLDGTKIDFDSIQSGDVILVCADKVIYDGAYPLIDPASEVYEILVSRERLSGKITGKSSEDITIDRFVTTLSAGLEYAISKSEASDVSIGLEAEFLLDYFGEIAGYNKVGNLPAYGKYGYIVDAWTGETSEGDSMAVLKLFDFGVKNTELVYCADNVFIDGVRYKDGTTQLNALKRQYSGDYTTDIAPRLVVYKVNDEGEINFIDTDYTSPSENGETCLTFDENQQTDMYSSMVFGGNIGMGENTIVLAVPKARAASNAAQTFPGSVRTYICNKNMEDFIYFRSSFSSNSTKYTVESYNMGDNGEAEVIVFYYTPVTKSGIISSETEKNMMVESVSQVVIGDEVGYEIRGFCNSSFNVLYINDDECVVADVSMDNEGNVSSIPISPMELNMGDIVRCSNIKQNTNLTIRVERVIKCSEPLLPNFKFYTQASEDSALVRSEYFNAFNVSCGSIMSCKNGIAKVDFGGNCKVYNLNNVSVCIYDKTDKTIYETDTLEIISGSEVVLVTSDGVVRACYLYR